MRVLNVRIVAAESMTPRREAEEGEEGDDLDNRVIGLGFGRRENRLGNRQICIAHNGKHVTWNWRGTGSLSFIHQRP